MKSKTKGISPKAVWAVVAAIAGYLLTQQVLDLPAGVDLLLNAVLVGGAAAAASPGTVARVSRRDGEDGYSLVELVVGVLLVLILVVLLLRLL